MRYNKWSFIVVPNQEALKWKDSLLQCVYMWICKFADEEWVCYPSYQTIADCAWCSRRTVVSKINKLVSEWLLQKTSRYKNKKQQSNLYQIMLRGAGDALPSAGDSPLRGAGDAHRTTTTSFNYPKELKERVLSYTKNEQILELIKEFIDNRKKMKKPLWDNSLKRMLNKLDKLAKTDEHKILLLEEAVDKCWLTVYPLKEEKRQQVQQPRKETRQEKKKREREQKIYREELWLVNALTEEF